MPFLRTLFIHPLGPALVLALGGGLLFAVDQISRWSLPARRTAGLARFRLIAALACLFVALFVLIWLRQPPVRGSLQWAWQPLTVAGSTLDWRLDAWNWLAALLILSLTSVNLLIGGPEAAVRPASAAPSARSLAHLLWLGAAALATVFAGNVITLATCALALDAALAYTLRPERSAEPAGRAWGLLTATGWLLLVLLTALGEDGVRTPLIQGAFSTAELAILWLIALARSGVYPLHFWLTSSAVGDVRDRLALHLIVPTTGLWLLGRIHESAGAHWLHRPEWAALGALALLGTALAAWVADDEGWRWRWIAVNRASLVVMAAYVADVAGPPALVWSLVTFSLGSALLAVGQATLAQWGWRLPAILAALVVWGLPGTPGFLARTVLILPTDLTVAGPLFVIIVVAESLLVAALWQMATGGEPIWRKGLAQPQPPPPTWGTIARLSLALGILAAPLIAWGLAPGQLASLAGLRGGDAFQPLTWLMTHARRSVWIGLVLSGAAGIGLGVARKQIFVHMRGWQGGITAIVSLEPLYRAIAFGLKMAGSGLQFFATLGEGEGYLGWLALAALVMWVLLRG